MDLLAQSGTQSHENAEKALEYSARTDKLSLCDRFCLSTLDVKRNSIGLLLSILWIEV